MSWNITACITIFPPSRGGRSTPLQPPEVRYSPPLCIPGHKDMMNCMIARKDAIGFDEPTKVRIELNCMDSEVRLFQAGTAFGIWEGRLIGQGVVIDGPSPEGKTGVASGDEC